MEDFFFLEEIESVYRHCHWTQKHLKDNFNSLLCVFVVVFCFLDVYFPVRVNRVIKRFKARLIWQMGNEKMYMSVPESLSSEYVYVHL